MSANKFRILSIDGGGVRGVFPAHILKCLEERLKVNPYDQFDMLAGTSTGSIVAAGIACGRQPSEIVDLYRKQSSKIFGKRKRSWLPEKYKQGIHSVFERENLETLLRDEFGDYCLGDIKKPLLIPATDIGHGGVHVFKSSYSKEFTRDANVLVRDAVLASCSAPTYFDPARIGEYLLADGGLWANNPSLAAAIDAQKRLAVPQHELSILSLGTGESRTAYGTNPNRDWGLLKGWQGKEFISFLLSVQAQTTQNYLQLLLKPDQLLRLNFESDSPLPLDDFSYLDDLISRADRTFTHASSELKNFFETNEEK